jgi:hypothetical protein
VRDELSGVDWPPAVKALVAHGWVRLPQAASPALCDELASSAPGTWWPKPHEILGVRQGGVACYATVDQAAQVVREYALTIIEGVAGSGVGPPAPPGFTDAEWAQDAEGRMFISAHRDPPTAPGVIAVTTLRGAATFRIWDDRGVRTWETDAGDLVLLRGSGWPSPEALCPLHEVGSPVGPRMTLTLRHNTGGPGADYFA